MLRMKLPVLFASTFLMWSTGGSGSIDINSADHENLQFKNWVNTIMAKAMESSYSTASSDIPTYFHQPPFSCEKPQDNPVNILLLSDSIGRYMVMDICGHFHLPPRQWATNFTYEKGLWGSALCEGVNFRLAYNNIYGSQRTGPYLHGHVNTPRDPYADTELRIPETIRQYTQFHGPPDYVIFKTDLWDLQPRIDYLPHNGMRMAGVNITYEVEIADRTMAKYIEDHIWAYDLIKGLLPEAIIGTHTTPTVKWGLHLFHHFQNATRRLSETSNHFLYDWNLMLLSQPPGNYLRDYHHPNQQHTTAFTQLLIESMQAWKCSKYFDNRNRFHRNVIYVNDDLIYYTEFNTKRLIPNIGLYYFLRLSHPVVTMLVDDTALLNIVTTDPMPEWLTNNSLVLPWGTKQIYWMVDGYKRPVSGIQVFYRMGWDLGEVKHIDNIETGRTFERIPLGEAI